MDVYAWADHAINACPGYAIGFTELLAARPFRISSAARRDYDARLTIIRSFQKAALDIFRSALTGEMPPTVLHWLLNETPESIGLRFHCRLEDRHFTLPVFFRTDEVRLGRIIEIQCPGSLWGELQLAFEYATRLGDCSETPSPADRFATELAELLRDKPVVHHLLDSSSAPAGMRYFIERTRPRVSYWSIDRDVTLDDCNFVRNHSFYGLCADYALKSRLVKVGRGVTYDLPPYVLFDQKAALALPFWSVTREWFSDEVRNLFPFTTPLLPAGIELPDGSRVTVDEFSRRPQSQRSYYVKYAGADIALNWGSKAVYRLSNLGRSACRDFLQQCLQGYEKGVIWLLQKEETQEDEITYLARDGSVHTRCLHTKFCGYYGPASCFGVLAMHRHHFKVHGQADTVLSYVIADDGDGGNL